MNNSDSFATRPLAGRSVHPIGLGCMGMSEFYGATDDVQSLATLHAAADLGVTHFDTADTYGHGHNEGLLGRFLKELGAGAQRTVGGGHQVRHRARTGAL